MFFYNESDSEGSQETPGTTDPYFSNVSLLLSMDSDFSDSSNNNLTVNLNGNTSISTAESKFGGGSGYFDGSGDYGLIPSNTAYAMGTEDFTIELWYHPLALTNNPGVLVNYANSYRANSWAIHAPHVGYGSSFSFWVNNAAPTTPILQGTSVLQTGVWTHLALTREGNTWRMFVDGILEDTATSAASLDGGTGQDGLHIGVNFVAGLQRYAHAYMDDIRLTKGVARYTANFTPPTQAHPTQDEAPAAPTDPNFSNVSLLLSMDSDFSDSSSNNVTVTENGGILTNSSEYKYGGGSALFSGTKYLTVPSFSGIQFGTEDFTIETWFKQTASGFMNLFSIGPASAGSYSAWIGSNGSIGQAVYGQSVDSQHSATGLVSLNTWFHVAFVRVSGVLKIFLDGNEVLSTSYGSGIVSSDMSIGGSHFGVLSSEGETYFDDIRITKGVARYTANFTPPTQAHPTQAGQSPSPSIVTDSLSLHLDAGDITSYPGSGTDWFDISGNGNNAVLTNGPTYSGDAGGNFFFDGSNDFAITNNAAGISGDANATLSVWLKVPSLAAGSWKNALTFGNPYSAKGGMAIFVNSGNRQGSVAAGFFMGQNAFTNNNVLAIDSWYNIVFTKEAGAVNSSNTKIYINGQEQALDFSSVPSTVPNFTNTQVYVGKDSANQMFYGNIAAAMVYTKALTATEIVQNFDATKTRFGL